MTHSETSLVPLSVEKKITYDMHGDGAVYELNSRTISVEDRQRLNDLVDFVFVFGAHGTEADHYTEIESTFNHISDGALVCFESVGFSLVEEDKIRNHARSASLSQRIRMQREALLSSRNSIGDNYMTSTNAFFYAQQLSFANGFDVRFADMDRWHHDRFVQMAKASGYEQNEVSEGVWDAMLTEEWKALPLIEAATEFRRRLSQATYLIERGRDKQGRYIDPEVVPHWGLLHQHREEAVVDRVVGLALKKLSVTEHTPERKLPVFTFFGASHARGIRQRFSERGLAMRSIVQTREPVMSSSNDIPIAQEDVQFFAREWVGSQLYQLFGQVQMDESRREHFSNTVGATKRAIDLMPFDEVVNLYESFRVAMKYFDTPRDNESMSPLARALALRRMQHSENKEIVFENLLLQAMSKHNMKLEDATQKYVAEREASLAKVYGRIS